MKYKILATKLTQSMNVWCSSDMNNIKLLTSTVLLSLTLSTAYASNIDKANKQKLLTGMGTMTYYDEHCDGLNTSGRQRLNTIMGSIGVDIRKLPSYLSFNIGYTFAKNVGCEDIKEAIINGGHSKHLKES